MFSKRESKNGLSVPPIAVENPAAVEVLRVGPPLTVPSN